MGLANMGLAINTINDFDRPPDPPTMKRRNPRSIKAAKRGPSLDAFFGAS